MRLNHRQPSRLRRCRRERGLSLVELMVGVAVGLFVVAGAATLTGAQLSENRRLLLETQLQQDLRSSADIIARDLRRAGHWTTAEAGVATPSTPSAPNPWATVTRTGSTQVEYQYRRNQDSPTNAYGFKLDAVANAIQTKMDSGGWQELTDSRTMRITNLAITEVDSPAAVLPCPKLCPVTGTDSCWPRVVVRSLDVDITGQAVSDPQVQRRLRTNVRLRNDLVRFDNPANPICPV